MNNKILKIYKVVVALSGGVDSSVTIWILKQLGFKIKCVFIKCWESKNCQFKKDLKDCKTICKLFNIKLIKINLSYEYWNKVFKIFIKELKKSKTPNPDILCNKEIKFNIFIKFSINILKADFISTGHYVNKYKKNNLYLLIKSKDKKKDQSYFLYNIKQKQLNKCIFPLGNYIKKNIRKIAKNLNLPNSNKKDSTGICFIGKKKYFIFIKKYIKKKIGNIINLENNKIIGIHEGLFLYTIGQRKNLYLKNGYKKPLYVVKKNVKTNELIVCEKNNKLLYKKIFFIKKIHFIHLNYVKKKIKCKVKIRYQQKSTLCKIYFIKKNNIKIILKTPLFAITIGQSAVFYKKNICLGGGIINKII